MPNQLKEEHFILERHFYVSNERNQHHLHSVIFKTLVHFSIIWDWNLASEINNGHVSSKCLFIGSFWHFSQTILLELVSCLSLPFEGPWKEGEAEELLMFFWSCDGPEDTPFLLYTMITSPAVKLCVKPASQMIFSFFLSRMKSMRFLFSMCSCLMSWHWRSSSTWARLSWGGVLR